MKIPFGDLGMTLIVLLTLVAAIIYLLPIYRDWEGKKKASALKKKLELQKKVQAFQERRGKIPSPQIELPAAS